MDIAAARSRLVHETRARLGDVVTLRALVVGDMSASSDPDRPAMVGLAGRFDIDPGLEPLGGRDKSMAQTRFAGRMCSLSIPRADMAWLPKKGDRAELTSRPSDPVYSIVRVADDRADMIVMYLSALEATE